MITSLFPELGRPVIKYKETFVHIEAGRGKGCKVLSVFIVSPLLRWKMSHSTTNVKMSCFILAQKKGAACMRKNSLKARMHYNG